MKVATGFALPCGPGALWHGTEIPAGYAHVGVDEIEWEYEELELDFPTPEGRGHCEKSVVVLFSG